MPAAAAERYLMPDCFCNENGVPGKNFHNHLLLKLLVQLLDFFNLLSSTSDASTTDTIEIIAPIY